MTFNLKTIRKTALEAIPPLGDVAYNPDNPMYMSFQAAAMKMLPFYQARDATITDINSAMAKLGLNAEDVMQDAQGVNTETLQEQEDAVNVTDQMVQQLSAHRRGSVDKFNLKKAQEAMPPMDPMGLNDSPELMGDELEMQQDIMSMPQPPFSKIEDFRKWADNTDMSTVLQAVIGQTGDHLKEAMEQYYTADDEGVKGQIAAQIFSDPSFPLREEQTVKVTPKHIGGEVHDILKKIASKTSNSNKGKSFNLKKTAQHKTVDNAILWGPGQTRIDPFLRQPVSDWHIVERNKGFGLVVDDIWNIDYETIWRENVMDKYSRPYRDKDGNWVGGYIQKRFEVDKNIPEVTNMQLKPGQKRKPRLPEYGNTEARLQAARAAGEIEGAKDTSKPFNWKEAKKKS